MQVCMPFLTSGEAISMKNSGGHLPSPEACKQGKGWAWRSRTGSKSPDLQVVKQVQNKARTSVQMSGSGLVKAARGRHNPAIAGHSHSNKISSG